MSQKPKALVCTRLGDMTVTHPEQVTRCCSRCFLPVGVYPSGRKALKHHPGMQIVCSVCADLSTEDLLRAQPAGSWVEIRQEARDSRPVRKQ